MNIEERIAFLLGNNQEILAIKECREFYGIGLKEAKDHIDRIKAQVKGRADTGYSNAMQPGPDAAPDIDARIRQLLNQNNKIQAIKEYREFSGTDLRQAKSYVEELERGQLSQGAPGADSPEIQLSGKKYEHPGLNLEPRSSKSPVAGVFVFTIAIVLVFIFWFLLR